jgi:hypothetical protein
LLHVYLLQQSHDLVAVKTCLQSHCLAMASPLAVQFWLLVDMLQC